MKIYVYSLSLKLNKIRAKDSFIEIGDNLGFY